MTRFYKDNADKYGRVTIYDLENSEPVCRVEGRWHPYAADLFIEALRRTYPNVRPNLEEAARKLWSIPDSATERDVAKFFEGLE